MPKIYAFYIQMQWYPYCQLQPIITSHLREIHSLIFQKYKYAIKLGIKIDCHFNGSSDSTYVDIYAG